MYFQREEWCAYRIEQSENWLFNVSVQSHIFFFWVSVLLWMVVEVLQQSIYMWIQFICPKKEKQNWFFMIIDCTDKIQLNILKQRCCELFGWYKKR